jgi:transcriptional regulator with XRE-family HTH domain
VEPPPVRRSRSIVWQVIALPRRTSQDTTIGERIQARRQMRGWSIRHAASRAGISHATWSRIERGLQAADNRFLVADIAAALECSVAELVGVGMSAVPDRDLISARASVYAIREALVEADFDERPTVEAAPLAALEQETALVGDLQIRCDYAGAGRRLPDLIRRLHASANGPEHGAVLGLMVHAGDIALNTCKYVGYPAEGWLGAEWARRAAERIDDPARTGYAAFARAHAATGCGAYNRGHTLASRAVDDLAQHASAANASAMLGMLLLTAGYTAYATKRASDGAEYFTEAERLAERTGETTTFNQFFGPTNVAVWRIATEVDGGDPDEAVRIALGTNPSALPSAMRKVMFYLDGARALGRVRRDADATRYLVTAERIAPQLVHASPLAAETARGLRDRAGGSQLRGLCERMGMLS